MRAALLVLLFTASACTVTVRHEVDRDQLARVESMTRQCPAAPSCDCPSPTPEPTE